MREVSKPVWKGVLLCCWRRDCKPLVGGAGGELQLLATTVLWATTVFMAPARAAGGELQLWATTVCRYFQQHHNITLRYLNKYILYYIHPVNFIGLQVTFVYIPYNEE